MANRHFLFKLGAALLIGFYGTIFYIQQNERFITIVGTELQKQFKTQLGVEFQGKISSLNLVLLSVTVTDAVCNPVDKKEGWKWQADEFHMSLSWLSFFYHRLFDLDILFKNYHVDTTLVKGRLSIIKHIYNFVGSMQSLSLHIALRSVLFQKATTVITDANGLIAHLKWNGQAGKAGHLYKSRFYFIDGDISVGSLQLASQINGIMTIILQPGVPLHYRITNDLRLKMNHLSDQDQLCSLEGTWDESQGACVLNNHDYSFHIDPLRTYAHRDQFMVKGTITLPLAYVSKLVGGDFFAHKTTGVCDISFMGDPGGQISGMVTVKQPAYETYGVDTIELSFVTDKRGAHGSFRAHKEEGRFAGAWHANMNKKLFQVDLVNHTPWPVSASSYWEIPSHEGRVSCTINPRGRTHADYRVRARHTKTDSVVHSHGSCSVSSTGKLYALGHIDEKKYSVYLQLFPEFKPFSILYKDEHENTLFEIGLQPPHYKEFRGTLSYTFIKNLVRDMFDYDLSGKGTFNITGTYDKQRLQAHLYTEGMTIRLPETYNFISSVSGDCNIDLPQKRFELNNFVTQFHKGSFSCSRALIELNEQFELSFLHAPFKINKCFLNWKDDFFAVTSGACVLQKQSGNPYSIDGFMVIEKGQLKENPLSQKGQQEVTQFVVPSFLFTDTALNLNLSLITRDPLYIKTPQLQSRAVVDVKLTNTAKNIKLSGALNLLGGMIQFPYKPLYITRSEIRFLNDHSYDPVIDFVAQGMVKKYAITLSVSGTVQDPHIVLNSNPVLTEEQIIALLFTGSIEESLNIMVPTLVMRNIEAFLFGAATYSESDHWFDPLKKIRIVPSFTDQTGRGGFRGALEIDVSDHLHAKIQKNFSLSEDTRIEVEYLISDDMSIRALKDERSDVGAELEMRFKF